MASQFQSLTRTQKNALANFVTNGTKLHSRIVTSLLAKELIQQNATGIALMPGVEEQWTKWYAVQQAKPKRAPGPIRPPELVEKQRNIKQAAKALFRLYKAEYETDCWDKLWTFSTFEPAWCNQPRAKIYQELEINIADWGNKPVTPEFVATFRERVLKLFGPIGYKEVEWDDKQRRRDTKPYKRDDGTIHIDHTVIYASCEIALGDLSFGWAVTVDPKHDNPDLRITAIVDIWEPLPEPSSCE